jgi:glycosyltransferase involved in cell wall biosynthesis
MKILFLADGNSSHTKNWVNLLTREGNDTVLFSLVAFNKLDYISNQFVDSHLNSNNNPENDFFKLRYLSAFFKLRRVIKKIKPDIVHAHYATSYGLLAVLLHFRPTIISVWGSDVYQFPKKSFLHKFILKTNLRLADFILSTSSAMAHEARLYTDKKIEITPFGVDTVRFKPENVKTLFSKDDIVIGTIKTMEEIYGIEYLIKAFSILRKKYSNLKLLLVGGTSNGNLAYLTYLKQLIKNLDIANDTMFTGQIPFTKVPDYHNMMTVAVYVSLRESFGVSVLESQACGKAVVVSNIGGLPEVVNNGKSGFIVNSENEIETAHAIDLLLQNVELRREMGINARKWVEDNFSQKIVANKMISIYNSVMIEKEKSKNNLNVSSSD